MRWSKLVLAVKNLYCYQSNMALSRSFCSDLGCIALHILTAEITIRPAGVSAVHLRNLWRCCIPSWADVSNFGSGSFEKPVFLREIAVRLCCQYKHLGKVGKLDWSCTPHSPWFWPAILITYLDVRVVVQLNFITEEFFPLLQSLPWEWFCQQKLLLVRSWPLNEN